ncbi:hypothetical protein CCR75_004049 [Bremia lactucae]|uniref:Uncharacterized protein n=1 Tax=Bremia lactucae TaxID=4779 RepID=A0A976IB06_BRELC|nr:hypothetical protein CCR75_004049 [Bremia lactucae]
MLTQLAPLETATTKPSNSMPAQGLITVAQELIPFQNPDDIIFEVISWGFAILYILHFFVGKAQNRKIASKWLKEAEPVLRTQFSFLGSSVDDSLGLIEESYNTYKYFCTGRRFLTHFVASLERSQSLVSIATSSPRPYLPYLPYHCANVGLFSKHNKCATFHTVDVGLHSEEMDPFIIGIIKKRRFTALSKTFPELIEIAKQITSKEIPESMWIATDCAEIPKAALTHSIQSSLKDLEDFIESIVVTDMNKQLIMGLPKTQTNVLRARFKLHGGSKKLNILQALQLIFALVDAVGATTKLSSNAKHSANKRRLKIKQAADAVALDQENEVARYQAKRIEKKQKEYESLSYEEQQKIDAKNEKRAARKRFNRKK